MTDTSTATAPYRAVTRHTDSDRTWAACRGVNHVDGGEIVIHDRCGVDVVRREDGRIFDVELAGYYQARKFSCYHGDHVCSPADVEAVAAAKARALADGEIVKGATVEVFKGRKVAKGTVGRVAWIGESAYGVRVGLAIEGTQGLVYTAVANVRPVA